MPQTDAVLKDGISGTALPVRRVAAGMKDSNHEQGVIFENKEERVWKAAQEGAANVPKDDRKLSWVIAHPYDQGVNRLAETSAQRNGFAFVLILCRDQLRARGLTEDNTTGNVAQVQLFGTPT